MLSISTTNDYTGQTEVKNGVLRFDASAAYTGLTNNIMVYNGGVVGYAEFWPPVPRRSPFQSRSLERATTDKAHLRLCRSQLGVRHS